MHASSELWFARDHTLDAPILLRVFDVGMHDSGTVDGIKRTFKRHRQLHHPGIARVFDLHDADSLLFVSMDVGEGELLSSVLEREGRCRTRRWWSASARSSRRSTTSTRAVRSTSTWMPITCWSSAPGGGSCCPPAAPASPEAT